LTALDDIAAQRERIAQKLARVDAERAKLAEELADLEAAERVLSRLGQPRSRPGRRGRSRRTEQETKPVAARGRSARPSRTGRRSKAEPGIRLSEATLRAVEALGNDVSAEQVRAYLADQLGLSVRPTISAWRCSAIGVAVGWPSVRGVGRCRRPVQGRTRFNAEAKAERMRLESGEMD
jgi:hypothetical protein